MLTLDIMYFHEIKLDYSKTFYDIEYYILV